MWVIFFPVVKLADFVHRSSEIVSISLDLVLHLQLTYRQTSRDSLQ